MKQMQPSPRPRNWDIQADFSPKQCVQPARILSSFSHPIITDHGSIYFYKTLIWPISLLLRYGKLNCIIMALHNGLISISNPKQIMLILDGMSTLPEEVLGLSRKDQDGSIIECMQLASAQEKKILCQFFGLIKSDIELNLAPPIISYFLYFLQ